MIPAAAAICRVVVGSCHGKSKLLHSRLITSNSVLQCYEHVQPPAWAGNWTGAEAYTEGMPQMSSLSCAAHVHGIQTFAFQFHTKCFLQQSLSTLLCLLQMGSKLRLCWTVSISGNSLANVI